MHRVGQDFARTSRGSRALVFGSLAALLTLVGHVAVGGAPTPLFVLVALAFAAWHRLSLGAKPMSWRRLIAAAVLAQLMAHVLMSVGAHAHTVGGDAVAVVPVGSMLAIHVVLAVVMAFVVRHAETRAIARLCWERLLRILQPWSPVLPVRPSALAFDGGFQPNREEWFLGDVVTRRGPPCSGRLPCPLSWMGPVLVDSA
jgi:hypothetical protein